MQYEVASGAGPLWVTMTALACKGRSRPQVSRGARGRTNILDVEHLAASSTPFDRRYNGTRTMSFSDYGVPESD